MRISLCKREGSFYCFENDITLSNAVSTPSRPVEQNLPAVLHCIHFHVAYGQWNVELFCQVGYTLL
jgi:hypothetical protein